MTFQCQIFLTVHDHWVHAESTLTIFYGWWSRRQAENRSDKKIKLTNQLGSYFSPLTWHETVPKSNIFRQKLSKNTKKSMKFWKLYFYSGTLIIWQPLSRWFKHSYAKTGRLKSGLFGKVARLSRWSHFKVPPYLFSFLHQAWATHVGIIQP